MVARITTVAFQGTESRCIDVQVQVVSGVFNLRYDFREIAK